MSWIRIARSSIPRLCGATQRSRVRGACLCFSSGAPTDSGNTETSDVISLHRAPLESSSSSTAAAVENLQLGSEDQGFAEESKQASPTQTLENKTKKCADHLDPEGRILPKSCWIHIHGIPPLCTLDMVLDSIAELIIQEFNIGIVDLDALWNPATSDSVPLVSPEQCVISMDDDHSSPRNWIQAAHVVLSSRGRPTGYHIKFRNRSIVNAILAYSQSEKVYCSWKEVFVKEWEPSNEEVVQTSAMPIVDESMIRVENVHQDASTTDIMLLFRRHNLATQGRSVIRWLDPGGIPSRPMYIVRFEDASWARAAIREVQSKYLYGQKIVLVQYPNQIRYDRQDVEDNDAD